jgi:pseudouridine synthase
VLIDGRRTAPASVRLRGVRHGARRTERPDRVRSDSPSTIEITVHEGRSRQVRKMCLAIGHPVLRLRRIRIGPIADQSLKIGACRPLTAREVAMLKRSTGLEGS